MVATASKEIDSTPAEQPSENGREAPAAVATGTPGFLARLGALLVRRWIVVVLAIWIAGNVAALFYFRAQQKTVPTPPPTEIALGDFQFRAEKGDPGRVASAKFGLHVSLIEDSDVAARKRLVDRQFRVQQDIEELLRGAHSGDFADPTLKELKRQLQERINETLGMKSVADVIITNLAVIPAAGS
jgi:flagellar basal body-associated protein FliL